MSDIKLKGLDFSSEDVASIINGARSYKQFLGMINWIEDGVCRFCPEHRDSEKNKVILTRGEGKYQWVAWRNPYPHDHTEAHFIIIPERHITDLKEMEWSDWMILGGIVNSIVKGEAGIDIDGGGFIMRFGNPAKNAGSVRHLHANIIIPDETGNVKATLAKDRGKIESTKWRVKIFDKLRQAKVAPGDEDSIRRALTKEEFSHVKDRI